MILPKAELHTHLEGTLHPETALKLAQRNHVKLPSERISADRQTYLFKDFLDFIHTYDEIVCSVLKSPVDFYDMTFDYLKRNAEGGAIYIEMMYSPELAEKNTGIPSIEHLEAIQQAINDAEAQFDIIGRVLMAAIRHFGADAATQVARLALKERLPCVVGFSLGGDEIHYPPEWFTEAFTVAHDGGLACTVHAGEFAPASTMITAMNTLPIQRIGHGVEAVRCPETLALLKDKNITLEVCPSSNIILGLFKDLASHPLPQLMEAGIPVCLNSDDPPFFRTTLAKEYERVQETFGFPEKIMLSFTKQAIEAAFVEEAVKEKLRQKCSLLGCE